MTSARRAGAVVVCDDVVDPALVAAELPPVLAAGVRAESRMPSGPRIVALLAGPGSFVTDDVLRGLPDLRAIVVTSMGWDHVDVDAARARGIQVTGVEPYCVDEVAEHTLALVLDLLRGVSWLDASVREGGWDYGRLGRPVRGTVLGIVGLGRIGAAVAWRGVVLGMDVVAYDPAVPAESAPRGVRIAASLDELVSGSDVVSIHVPLTPGTRTLVDAALLARFRPASYLVNVSRGEIVTESALGDALRTGRLAGAALDVLAHEPPSPDDPVFRLPRTVITAHSAWYSPLAIERLSGSAGRAVGQALAADYDAPETVS